MKRVLATIIGQSNEVGNGNTVDRVASWGFPLRDPIGPQGYARSAWPRLAELLGKRGVMFRMYNAAHGSTSLVGHWCGKVRNWSARTIYYGELILSNGGLWKANLTAGTYVASVTAPTGTADTTLDLIPWVYLGAPAVYEVDGYICKPGDAYFDPLGYTAASYSGLFSDAGTWDEKWLFISLGQQESLSAHATSQAEFTMAIRYLTDYFLAAGAKVAIGFTCYSTDANRETAYQTKLLPGRADALAYYAGNPNVCAGANWREYIGVVTAEASPTAHVTYPALQSDGLHMNDAMYVKASDAWGEALVAAGWA